MKIHSRREELTTLYVRIAKSAKEWLDSRARARGTSLAVVVNDVVVRAKTRKRKKK